MQVIDVDEAVETLRRMAKDCIFSERWQEGEEYAIAASVLNREALADELSGRDINKHIRQLEAKVPKWISVQERLPEDEEYVLCWYKDEFGDEWSTVGLKIQWGCGWDLDIDDNSGRNLTVTHWMPLPEPPEEE